MINPFVYGIFRRGNSANHILEQYAEHIRGAVTLPNYKLYEQVCAYLVEVPEGTGKRIVGDIYRITDKNLLYQIDQLEQNYVRWPILVEEFDEVVMAYLSPDGEAEVKEYATEIGNKWVAKATLNKR